MQDENSAPVPIKGMVNGEPDQPYRRRPRVTRDYQGGDTVGDTMVLTNTSASQGR